MNISDYFKKYIHLTKDPAAISELQELALDYNRKLLQPGQSSTILLQQYLEKAQRIARHSVTDVKAFEELVYRHNQQLRPVNSSEDRTEK